DLGCAGRGEPSDLRSAGALVSRWAGGRAAGHRARGALPRLGRSRVRDGRGIAGGWRADGGDVRDVPATGGRVTMAEELFVSRPLTAEHGLTSGIEGAPWSRAGS